MYGWWRMLSCYNYLLTQAGPHAPANGAETQERQDKDISQGEEQQVKCNENYLKAVQMTISAGRRDGYCGDSVPDIFTAFLTIVLDWVDFNNLSGCCRVGGV